MSKVLDKNEQKKIKDWLVKHKHEKTKVDKKKFDTDEDMINSIYELHNVKKVNNQLKI